MNELSLFTGAGGGVLGTQHLLGWRAVGYVEWDAYCQEVLKARIADGFLHDAPIFGDIRAFISSGCAEAYQGMVDVITAGFPCQPFSVAGKQRGADDERNMWPATIECIRVVRPRFALLENVPGLIATGYFATVIGDLAASGYDARWRVLSAAEVGAPHKRDRLWIVANAKCSGWRKSADIAGKERKSFCAAVGQESAFVTRPSGEDVAHADNQRLEGRDERGKCPCERTPWACSRAHEDERLARSGIRRVSHGSPARVDKLRALGNAQVPAVAASAWNSLTENLL